MAIYDLHLATEARAGGESFRPGRFAQVSLAEHEAELLNRYLNGSPISLVKRDDDKPKRTKRGKDAAE